MLFRTFTALAAALALTLAAGTAAAQRPPSRAESASLRAAVAAFVHKPGSPAARNDRIVRLAVSSIDRSYAVAELDSPTVGRSTLVLHRVGGTWKATGFGSSLSCAAGPRNVLSDLGVPCTPEELRISNCGRLVARPAELILTCADANYLLTRLTWSSWGSGRARGAGTVVANDCTPTCVAGKFHSYRATVDASRPRACPKGRRYTVVTIHYPRARPQGIAATDVHTFGCAY